MKSSNQVDGANRRPLCIFVFRDQNPFIAIHARSRRRSLISFSLGPMRTFAFITLVLIGIPSAPAFGAPPELRTRIPKTATKLGQIMTSPGQTREHYLLTTDGITWDVGASPDGRAAFVGTRSSNFRTPEGLSVGTRYSVLRARGMKQATAFPGFAWIVELPSGWRAAFIRGPGMTDSSLVSSTQISFLYRTTD